MRKAAIITAYNPYNFKGGIETYTLQLIALLTDYNIEVDLHCIDMIEKGYDFHNEFLGKIYSLGRRLSEFALEYDFVIANSFYGFSYFPPRASMFNIFHSTHAGFSEDIKDVISPVSYLELRYLYGELLESISSFNRNNIAVSESVADELKNYYGLNNVTVINNSIDTSIFSRTDKEIARRSLGIPLEAYVGLYIGRWDTTKGSDILEGVMKSKKASDVFWVLVLGTGTDRSLIPPIDNIVVFEHIEHEKMSKFYNAADFVLFSSRYESFGYIIIEALACETPVITTNVGVAKSIYTQEPFRKLLLPEITQDRIAIIESCIDKINLLRGDDSLRSEIVKKGRIVVDDRFSLTRWRKDMANILGITKT